MALIQSSRDGKELTGYQLLALGAVATGFKNGIVNKAGQEFLITYSGLNFNVGTGILIDNGLIVENNAIVSNIALSTGGVAGTKYLVCENNRDTGVSTFKFVSSLIETNFLENPQGTSHFLLATVQHSSGGITGVKENKIYIGAETEWVTISVNSPFSSPRPIKVKRVGNVVYMQGAFFRSSGSSSTALNTFQVPLGFRPAYDYYAPPTITAAATVYFNGLLKTDGNFSVQQASASSIYCPTVLNYITDDPFPSA